MQDRTEEREAHGGDSLGPIEDSVEASGHVTTRLAPPGDDIPLDGDSEPTMIQIGARLGGHILEQGQHLAVLVKPLSVTLLGGSRYRAVLKTGLPNAPDGLACVLVDVAAHAYTFEGSMSEMFEGYAEQPNPLTLDAQGQDRWFACRAVEAWIDRLMQSAAMRETAIWVE